MTDSCEEKWCIMCKAMLPTTAFSPSILKSGQKRCASCCKEVVRQYRKNEPLATVLLTIQRREKRLGGVCTITRVGDIRTVLAAYSNRCMATGKTGERLTLIRIDANEPMSLENAIPVCSSFARHHPVFPPSLVKNVERFKNMQ